MTRSLAAPTIRDLRISTTMSVYIARHFTLRFLSIFGVICGIIVLVDTVEQLDQLASKEGVSLLMAVEMALLKLPHLSQEVMPFAVLFAAMASFWQLTRTHELVVARAAGMSVWQLLAPIVLVGVLIGIVTTTVLNPVGSVMLRRYEQFEARYTEGRESTMAVAKTGLWLRQNDGDGHAVIHARRVEGDVEQLHDVTVFRFEGQSEFSSRIDADRARLRDGKWHLYDAWKLEPGQRGRFVEETTFETDLTPEKIYNSFAPPETIPFWSLPEFIDLLENAGLAAEPHRLQFHRLLAKPLLLAAMILVAAIFSLRPHRRGGIWQMIVAGVLSGFLLYVISSLIFALGLTSKLPVVLAAWTPAGVSLMLGVTGLLHLEDG